MWCVMAVLYEFRLPRAGHRSCLELVELSCLWIQAGRDHTNKIAPERLALVQCDGFLNSSYIFLFFDSPVAFGWSCQAACQAVCLLVVQEAGGTGNIW